MDCHREDIDWQREECVLLRAGLRRTKIGQLSYLSKDSKCQGGCADRQGPPVRIMPLLPSFSSISPIYCKTSCPKHDVKLHNYALMITTTTRGTCLRSRYPVLVIIRELEDSTSRPSVAS